MGVLNIREAQREGARMVIGIAGISGSGKTYTALQLAWGLAKGNAKKVGFIDTEKRRGSLYADTLVGQNSVVHKFLIGDLDAPFSPQRYIDAIKEFQAAGVEVLVIDSISHEWEGQGGCEDIANAPGPDGKPPKVKRWNKAKAEHKRFMNALLQCDMHVIACIRAREKVEMTQVGGKTEYKPLGIMPVCEKNFMFEMTASLMMWSEGRAQTVEKCPEALRGILGRGEGYITANDGLALRKWVDGAEQLNREAERARNELRVATEGGVSELERVWSALPEQARKAIGGKIPDEIRSAAKSFDEQRQPEHTAATDVNALLQEANADAE